MMKWRVSAESSYSVAVSHEDTSFMEALHT